MEKPIKKLIQPSQDEVEEALKFPNDYVYLIHPNYSADGKIVGDFMHNPSYIEQ